MSNWQEKVLSLSHILESLLVNDSSGKEITQDSAFDLWKEMALEIRRTDRTIYLIGNGASASMASHTAADLYKNAHIKTVVFTDPSLVTAVSNDLGYEEVFAEPLRCHLREGDMLVAISSSGESPNILNACHTAGKLGAKVVILSAMKNDNSLRSLGILNFYIPAATYGMAETGHAAILHFWVDQLTIAQE